MTADDLILPVFVTHKPDTAKEIPSMPGIRQWSVDRAVTYVEEAVAAGVRAVIQFGIPAVKDATGSDAYDPAGVVQRAIRAIRERCPEVVVIADT
ncbi:MAG: porphobilinogen synthase, partial [Gemmatimonadota bacterium]